MACLLYGLTGGIGSGKSTAATEFEALGVPVLDADAIGRELLAEGGPVTEAVLERYPECQAEGGGVDRQAVAERVFAQPAERRWLEDLLHPAILERVRSRLASLDGGRLALLEGAVLLESRTRFDLAGLVVVSAPERLRLRRLIERGSSPEDARARLANQLAESEKIARADHWIDNAGSRADTRERVRASLEHMLQETGGI